MTNTLIQKVNKDTKREPASRKQVRLTKAFGFAFYGLFLFIQKERNGKIQFAIAVLSIALGTALQIDVRQWIAVLLCTAAVLSLEMLNSAIEKLCDLIHPGYHPTIKIIKDVAAGAVLWTSVVSAVIGCIIFLPKIILLCFPGSHV